MNAVIFIFFSLLVRVLRNKYQPPSLVKSGGLSLSWNSQYIPPPATAPTHFLFLTHAHTFSEICHIKMF